MTCNVRLGLFMLLCPLLICGQEYSYTHYESKDGLAGSKVYCATQDKEGFLWFATETGVSRFDGTHFRNYNREDGLPDNDIIQLFADSKGRVWMAPFKKSVCYYYKGKIYNSDNDPRLKKLHIQNTIVGFAEDTEGNILLQDMAHVIHIIKVNGDVSTILTNDGKPLGYVSMVAGRKAGGFWVILYDKLYIYSNGRFTFLRTLKSRYIHFIFTSFKDEKLMWIEQPHTMNVMSMQENKVSHYPYNLDARYIDGMVVDDHHIACCTQDGALVYDLNYENSMQRYLPGIRVNSMFKDSEGNWWFCTSGKGVYRLNSTVVLNARLAGGKQQDVEVLSFVQYKEWILAATAMSVIYKLSPQTGKLEGQATNHPRSHYTILIAGDNRVIMGSPNFLVKLSAGLNDTTNMLLAITVKAMGTHKDKILIATDRNAFVLDPVTLKIRDTIWHERTTCIFSNNDTIYIGGLNGLHQITPDKKVQLLDSTFKPLQNRIAAVCEDANHIIWVATAGEGLIGWRNGKLIKHITRDNGLTSNICRTLFYENGQLWVGTEKGLNKVHVLKPGFPIEKYTTSDGLSSDIINAVYVNKKKVFVGTPEGLTFFDEDKMTSQSRCDLRFVDITVGNETFYPADAPVTIPHAKNSLQFNYVGISFKSNGDIHYRYRLLGLDSAWKETRETFLSYPILPSGDYQLQLQAINKFDVHSQVLTAGFTIEKLLYEKTWFRLLIGLLFLAVTGATVFLITRRIRKREREKTAISKRISELEQLSRKAQMNPHFIFNSLNSIQQYVMDADVAGANRFIAGFSRLIRQTLDFSSKPEISLEEELDYLTNYLELEKTRLENAFLWSVVIDKAVHPADYYIPPMILQPFVENSVRHGLRFRKDKAGIVTITVRLESDQLICILEDNGVGRKAAMKYKSISPINYQSKGLSLTADRIAMFNKEHEQQITMQIDDLENDLGNALGTRVTIHFPVF
jgi:histidine kinase/YXYXY domain-containing protein/two component regulator with propeller domain